MRTEEVLSLLRGDLVEGHTFKYGKQTFFRPYQTIVVNEEKINGLREDEERAELFKKIILDSKCELNSYLDIACNLGFFVNYFSSVFKKVCGIDMEDLYIKIHKLIYKKENMRFIHANLNKMKLKYAVSPDKEYDVVTALSMIEYIDNKKEFIDFLFNMTKYICIIEGHTMDKNLGHDEFYDQLIRSVTWKKVERFDNITDAGINAPTNNLGRPLWICYK